ncbi:MAG: hypothetical protein V1944_02370 [Candidatus Aenigmatarchaeota archaeon]
MTRTEYLPEDRNAVMSVLHSYKGGVRFGDFREFSATRHLDTTQLGLILRDARSEGLVTTEVERFDHESPRVIYLLTQTYARVVELREKYQLELAKLAEVKKIDESVYGISVRYHPDSLSAHIGLSTFERSHYTINKYVDHRLLDAERELKVTKDILAKVVIENSRDVDQGHFDRFSLNLTFSRFPGKPARIPPEAQPAYTRSMATPIQRGIARKGQMLRGFGSNIVFVSQGDEVKANEYVDTLDRFYEMKIPTEKEKVLRPMITNFFEIETPAKSLRNNRVRIGLKKMEHKRNIEYLRYCVQEILGLGLNYISPE